MTPRIEHRLCESGALPPSALRVDCPNTSAMDATMDGVAVSLCEVCAAELAHVVDAGSCRRPPGHGPIAEAIDGAARDAYRVTLIAVSGNVRRAAEALDVSYASAHRDIRRLGLLGWLTDEYELGARQPART